MDVRLYRRGAQVFARRGKPLRRLACARVELAKLMPHLFEMGARILRVTLRRTNRALRGDDVELGLVVRLHELQAVVGRQREGRHVRRDSGRVRRRARRRR